MSVALVNKKHMDKVILYFVNYFKMRWQIITDVPLQLRGNFDYKGNIKYYTLS